jgi:hypothetical protein
MFKIGIGRAHARTRVICLAKDPDIRIIDAATGEILRTLTLATTRTYQPAGKPEGGPKGPRKPKRPNPYRGFGYPGCLATSHCGAGGNRTPVHQPMNVLATTIPGVTSNAEAPTGRLPDQAGPRSVFPESQQSFPLAMVFSIVIPHFCCRAVVEWPRATFLLTITLHSSEINQAARAKCSSAILFFSPFYESEKLGSQTRTRLLTSKPVSPVLLLHDLSIGALCLIDCISVAVRMGQVAAPLTALFVQS